MHTITNLLAAGLMIGFALGIPLLIYLALDAILYGAKVVGIFLGALIVAGLAFAAYTYWQRERHRMYRVIDGSLPLQRHKINGHTITVDPNKLPGAAYIIGPDIGYQEIASSVGPQIQLLIDQSVQQTRSLAAITPGDDALIRTRGAIDQPRLPANVTKMLPPKPTAPIEPAQLTPSQPAPRPAIPTQQMIAAPSPQTTQLAIGENSQGEIVHVDLRTYPFLRIHGATQSGKTALALLLVAQALRHGYEVDIYDTRKGKDWGIFADRANLIDSRNPAALIDGLRAELHRYRERDAQLSAQGVGNLHDLATASGQQYRRRLIVIEEMGNQTLSVQDEGKETYTRFTRILRRITTEAGATGIHGLYIDQVPVAWDKTIRYNAAMICFQLPDHGGKVAGYPAAFQLEKYHCHFEGQIIRAGHLTDEQIQRVISVAPHKPTAHPDQWNGSVPSSPTGSVTVRSGGTPPSPQPTEPTEPEPTDHQQAAARLIAANPETTQADLRQALGIAKSYAHELWHTLHPGGKNYQPDQYGWIPAPKE